jgi:D-beta-D-heptose 7-phosphate kinase/D-beta-D-heptose 1-phosphate adenosyltransferase
MTLFEKGGRLANEPANTLEVYDVTGAGDTVTALFGLSLIQGILPAEAAHVANIGAGIVVGKMGTATVSLQEMEAALSGGGERKVLSRSDVFNCLQAERAKGRQVVFTNGCFDLLHVGHIQYLQQARNLGDLLVVGLNDDASVGRVKGEGRPLIEERQRAELLAALMCVDYVVYFPEDTPDELIRALRPDILVKGGDYSRDQVAGRSFVESYGGRVEVLPFVDGVSTTKIVKTIIERYSGCTDQK